MDIFTKVKEVLGSTYVPSDNEIIEHFEKLRTDLGMPTALPERQEDIDAIASLLAGYIYGTVLKRSEKL